MLDEPSTGMDPLSRRRFWNIVTKLKEKGCTVLLSTHAMEEATALCDEMLILMNGKIECMGTVQEVKS